MGKWYEEQAYEWKHSKYEDEEELSDLSDDCPDGSSVLETGSKIAGKPKKGSKKKARKCEKLRARPQRNRSKKPRNPRSQKPPKRPTRRRHQKRRPSQKT